MSDETQELWPAQLVFSQYHPALRLVAPEGRYPNVQPEIRARALLELESFRAEPAAQALHRQVERLAELQATVAQADADAEEARSRIKSTWASGGDSAPAEDELAAAEERGRKTRARIEGMAAMVRDSHEKVTAQWRGRIVKLKEKLILEAAQRRRAALEKLTLPAAIVSELIAAIETGRLLEGNEHSNLFVSLTPFALPEAIRPQELAATWP